MFLLKLTQGESIRNYYHENHVVQDMLMPLYKVGLLLNAATVHPIRLCPHRLFKLPVKTMFSPEPGFDPNLGQGDTPYAQMYTELGVYYAAGPILRGEVFVGVKAVRRWRIG